MGISIVTVYQNQKALIETKWFPLVHKYPVKEAQFVFVDNFSPLSLEHFAPKLPQLTTLNTGRKFVSYDDALMMGVANASHENVLITSIYAIPTYETMLRLVEMKSSETFSFRWVPKTKRLCELWKTDFTDMCADAYLVTKALGTSPIKIGTMYDARP